MCVRYFEGNSSPDRFLLRSLRILREMQRILRTMETLDSYSSTPNSLIFIFNLHLHRVGSMGLLGMTRIIMTQENQSAFEINGHGVFMIMAIAALFVVEVVSWILFCTKIYLHPSTRGNGYTILKFMGSFSMFLAPFSLYMLLFLPPKFNWIAYLVICVMFGIILASFYSDAYQQDKKRPLMPTFNYWRLVLVPLSLVLVLFVPQSLNWIIYSVICVSIVMENAYHTVT